MRFALISDIHGNAVALKAVLDDIHQKHVDQIFCLGDVATLGPEPGRTIRMLRDLDSLCILGNHDAFMNDPGLIHQYTDVPVIIAAVDWCRDRLTRDELEYFKTFKMNIEVPLNSQNTMLLFHGSPASNTQDILATTSSDKVDQLLGDSQAAFFAGGHTHIQMLRQHKGRLIVNPGSVGIPFKEYVSGGTPTILDHAEYCIVSAEGGSFSVDFIRVQPDKFQLRETIAASTFPLRDMLLAQYS